MQRHVGINQAFQEAEPQMISALRNEASNGPMKVK
jgi:hypothetical protein